MSFSVLPVIEIDCQLPVKRVVDPQWIDSQIEAAIAHQQASCLLLSVLNSARRKAEKILRDSYRLQRQQKVELEKEKVLLRQNTLEQMEAEWLAKHVKHLLEDEAVARQWVDQAVNHIHDAIEQVLTAWFDEQPHDRTLCHRLAKQAHAMAKEGALTLRIHPEKLARMREAFGERFTLVADPDFLPDQAELSSPKLSVEFSLSCHFRLLLGWLRQSEPSGGTDGG